MKRLMLGLAGLLGVAAIGFFGFAPGVVERGWKPAISPRC
jgi:hypothetical protein